MPTHIVPLEFTELPTLDFEADAVTVEVLPVAAGEQPRAEVDSKRGTGSAQLEVTKHQDTLRVRLPGTWADAFAAFDLVTKVRFFVPAHVRASIVVQGGKVWAHDLAGCDLKLRTSAGTLDVENARGRFVIAVDSGAVRGSHLGGTFDVRCQAGTVRLGIDALDAGEHRVRTNMGSVKVELAKGIDVRVETSTTLGTAHSKYPSNSSARATLLLEADLGSVKVREGGTVDDPRHGDWPDWRKAWQDVVTAFEAPVSKPSSAPAQNSPEELRRVLELVQEGKLTASDAERLIRALR